MMIPTNAETPADPDETLLKAVWVVIPARNEEASLPLVLRDLPQVGRVIVADNGSTDDTRSVSEDAGAHVVFEPIPGYGRACLAALTEADRLAHEFEAPQVIVFLDGDYSDHPDQLPELVTPLLSGKADFVLGSRLLGDRQPGAMPLQAVLGNKLACALMTFFWRTNYTDLGPFRAISWVALKSLQMEDQNFGWTVEMQIKATLAGLRIREVPVSYRRRIGVSKISGTVSGTIQAGYKILWTIAKFAWRMRKWKPATSEA